MQADFDVKAAIHNYTNQTRDMLRADKQLNNLIEVSGFMHVNAKLVAHGFIDCMHTSYDTIKQLEEWIVTNQELINSFSGNDRAHVDRVLYAARILGKTRVAACDQELAIFKALKVPQRTNMVTAQLQHINAALHITENGTDGMRLTDVQRELVTSHLRDLVTHDIESIFNSSEAKLKVQQVAPTMSAMFVTELDEAFRTNAQTLQNFLNRFEKDIAIVEKPSNPRNWIIGSVAAAVVAVGAWMLAQNQKPAQKETEMSPAR